MSRALQHAQGPQAGLSNLLTKTREKYGASPGTGAAPALSPIVKLNSAAPGAPSPGGFGALGQVGFGPQAAASPSPFATPKPPATLLPAGAASPGGLAPVTSPFAGGMAGATALAPAGAPAGAALDPGAVVAELTQLLQVHNPGSVPKIPAFVQK